MLVALCVALSSTSYAAITIPRNSVGPTQIRRNAVTSAKVSDRSLVWNSDLMETLEFENLIVQAATTFDVDTQTASPPLLRRPAT